MLPFPLLTTHQDECQNYEIENRCLVRNQMLLTVTRATLLKVTSRSSAHMETLRVQLRIQVYHTTPVPRMV